MKNITLEDYYYNYCTINGKKPEKRQIDVDWFKFIQYVRDNNIKIVGNVMGEFKKFLSTEN